MAEPSNVDEIDFPKQESPPQDHPHNEPRSSKRSQHSWLVVLIAIAVWIGANAGAIYYLDRYPANRAFWIIKEKWHRLAALEKPVDWMLLGDSSCNQGVVPSVWNKALHTRSINLCTIGNALLVDDVWMLSEHIERLGPPKNVMIIHVYDMWPRDFEVQLLGQMPLLFGFWDRMIPHVPISKHAAKDFFVGRYLPLYSQSESLKKVVRSALKDPTSVVHSDFHMDADGYMPWPRANPKMVVRDFREHQWIARRPFRISKPNREALDRLAELANTYKFNVYLSNSPMYEGGPRYPRLQQRLNKLFDTLDQWADKSPRVHVMRTIETYPAKAMLNFDHAIHPTAVDFTGRLARRVQASLESTP